VSNSEVIFQALEPLQPHFIKNTFDRDDSMIPDTKTTNTGPFLWNGLSKIKKITV
jgi:hypothetical protein